MNRRKIFSILFCLTVMLGFDQNALTQTEADFDNIFFGDVQKSKSSIRSFQKTKLGDLLCIQSNHPAFVDFSKKKTRYTFNIVSDFSIPQSRPINFKGSDKNANLVNYAILGEAILGLSYQSNLLHRGPEFYYHYINPYVKEKVNHGQPVSIFNSRFNDIDYSRLAMISKEDASYAAALYLPYTKPTEHTLMKYAIFKADFSTPIEHELIFQYPSKDYNPIDFYVFDEKEQLFITGHYPKQSEKDHRSERPFYKSIGIHHLEKNQINTKMLDYPGVFFANVEIYAEKDSLLLVGLYSSEIYGGVEGFFSAQLSKEGEIKQHTFTAFPSGVQTQVSDFQERATPNPRFSQYESSTFNILDLYKTEEGLISVIEFNSIEYRYGGADMPGSMSTIDTYYWSGDLIVSKIDYTGKVVWSKVIPKSQRTVNDGGYYLSTSTYLGADYLHLFFNDNLNNYDNGFYHPTGERPDFTRFSNLKNTVAHVSIELKDGTVQRKSIVGKAETKVLFVPKLSLPFERQNKLMIYGVSGNKHRLGSITFPK